VISKISEPSRRRWQVADLSMCPQNEFLSVTRRIERILHSRRLKRAIDLERVERAARFSLLEVLYSKRSDRLLQEVGARACA